MTRIVLAGVFTAAAISVLAGQEVKPSFEVTSVRRNLSGPSSTPTQQIHPGGVFVAQNQLLARLIAFAYSVDDFRVIGGPGWMRDARYDVDARAKGDMSNEQLRLMLQPLLESRFALVVHREQREMAIYSLLLARDDARLGPGLQRVDHCNGPRPALPHPAAFYSCGSVSAVSAIASMMMGAPVVDRTGLTGTFNVAVSFSPEGVRPFAGEFVRPGQRSAGDQELPSLRDALRDQLGLKLESGRGPVDVLVIDSVQPPTEN